MPRNKHLHELPCLSKLGWALHTTYDLTIDKLYVFFQSSSPIKHSTLCVISISTVQRIKVKYLDEIKPTAVCTSPGE